MENIKKAAQALAIKASAAHDSGDAMRFAQAALNAANAYAVLNNLKS